MTKRRRRRANAPLGAEDMYFEEGEGEDDLGRTDGIVSPKLSATRSVVGE